MKHLRTGDPSVARRDPHARFSGIGTEPGRPANRGLRPEGHVAGGSTIRPGASRNSAWWATTRSIHPPRTWRDAATSVGTAPGYDHAPSAVWSERIGG